MRSGLELQSRCEDRARRSQCFVVMTQGEIVESVCSAGSPQLWGSDQVDWGRSRPCGGGRAHLKWNKEDGNVSHPLQGAEAGLSAPRPFMGAVCKGGK